MHSLRRQCMLVHRLGVASQPSGSTTTVVSSFLPSRRHMHQTSVQFARNHYDVLEITPKATQADVKTAYYKMSMIHHPDKNKGNAESVEKFRAITSAYEVLSNYRLRRLYDKGVVGMSSEFEAANRHDSADASPVYEEEPEPDDAQTQFYKRHMTRTETPHSSGRSPIYNFDEWAAAHYGKTFARKQHAQTRYQERQQKEERASDGLKSEIVIFGILVGVVTIFFIFFQHDQLDRDAPKKK